MLCQTSLKWLPQSDGKIYSTAKKVLEPFFSSGKHSTSSSPTWQAAIGWDADSNKAARRNLKDFSTHSRTFSLSINTRHVSTVQSLFFSLRLGNRWANQLPFFLLSLSLLGAVSLSWLPRRVFSFKSNSKVWKFQLSFSVSRGIWCRFSFWEGWIVSRFLIDLVVWCRSLQEPGRRVLCGSGRWDQYLWMERNDYWTARYSLVRALNCSL